MAEPLSKDTFEAHSREHQKYLDSKFDKLTGCINDVKEAREKAWATHAEECAACRDCQDKKMKKLHKYLVVGCVAAAIMGAVLGDIIGWQHLVGFVVKLLTGTSPVGL